jgi:hypothetical protein
LFVEGIDHIQHAQEGQCYPHKSGHLRIVPQDAFFPRHLLEREYQCKVTETKEVSNLLLCSTDNSHSKWILEISAVTSMYGTFIFVHQLVMFGDQLNSLLSDLFRENYKLRDNKAKLLLIIDYNSHNF